MFVTSARPPTQRSTSLSPVGLPAQVPALNMKSAASGGTGGGLVRQPDGTPADVHCGAGSTIAFAAARLPASVVSLVMLGCVPYAATKLINDSGCFKCCP